MILLLPFIFIQIPFAATKNNYHGNPPKTFIFRGYKLFHPYIQGFKKNLAFFMGFGGPHGDPTIWSITQGWHLARLLRRWCLAWTLLAHGWRMFAWLHGRLRYGLDRQVRSSAGWGTTSESRKIGSSETSWGNCWFNGWFGLKAAPLFIGVFPWFSAWLYECSISGISARHCTIIWIAWISC